MSSNSVIGQLESKSQIFQWVGEIFSCYGPFTKLPPTEHWGMHPDIEKNLKALDGYIQSERQDKGLDSLEKRIATVGTSYFEARQDGVILPLYGSWWLEGQLHGDSTHQVAEIMRAEEIEVTVETADYLPTELEFLSLLCLLEVEGHKRNEPALVQKGKDMRAAFVGEFIRPWIGAFEKKADQEVDSVYWKHLISILVVLLRNDF